MAEISGLPPALDAEMDQVLSLLPLVDAEPAVADKVFAALVDCLVEAVLHDLQVRHEHDGSTRAGDLAELCQVVVRLQQRGLLGGHLPPTR